MKVLALDQSGSMEHQASVMLELLEYLIQKLPVQVTVFDTDRKVDKYIVKIEYADVMLPHTIEQ